MYLLAGAFLNFWSAQKHIVEQPQSTNWFITVIIFVAMLVVLVFVHELGHFIVAIWMKIRVDEFGIGYPPRAMTLFERNGVKYTLNWLPLGGFVRFAGEDNAVYGVGSLAEARPWKKIPVMVAGPLMNFVLAVVIFALLFMFNGIPQPIGQRIGEIYAGTPAEKAGFQPKDILLSLNQEPVLSSQTISNIGNQHTGQPVTAKVIRENKEINLTVVPGPWVSPEGREISSGFGFSYIPEIEIQQVQISEAIGASLLYSFEILFKMLDGLARMVGSLFRLADAPSGGVAGPIGIARATGEVIDQSGFAGFWHWMALISLNLFVLNLLPIPALDGSHIIFSLIEWVRGGKKVPPEKEAMVHAIGFVALMGLIVLVSVSDVIHAFRGTSVLGGG